MKTICQIKTESRTKLIKLEMNKEIDNTTDTNKLQKVCYKNILLKSLFYHIAKSKRNEWILNTCDIPKLIQRKLFKKLKIFVTSSKDIIYSEITDSGGCAAEFYQIFKEEQKWMVLKLFQKLE